MNLTYHQMEAFVRDGFVTLPGLLSQTSVHQTLRLINHHIGHQGIEPDQLPYLRAGSYCPELVHDPAMTGLMNQSLVMQVLTSLIGEGKVREAQSSQIALRFPGVESMSPPRLGHHIDGVPTKHNRGTPGVISTFTALAVVLLSDVTEPWQGNFTVWPGTHRSTAAWFAEHGPESLLTRFPGVDLPQPVQITGKAGDVVLTHYQLIHAAAPNLGPHVRYATIFRVFHVDHEQHRPQCMVDIWMEYPAVQAFLKERPDLAGPTSAAASVAEGAGAGAEVIR